MTSPSPEPAGSKEGQEECKHDDWESFEPYCYKCRRHAADVVSELRSALSARDARIGELEALLEQMIYYADNLWCVTFNLFSQMENEKDQAELQVEFPYKAINDARALLSSPSDGEKTAEVGE